MRGLIDTVFKKLFLIISRGKLLKIDNTNAEMQKIQISNLADEVITDIERYQDYGFENYPLIANAEAVTLFVNGNRNANKGINVCVNNRKLRPTDLESGEVRIYSVDSNKSNKNYITIKPTDNTIHIITADNKEIILDTNKIEIKDADGNDIILDTNGIKITDKNTNETEMSSTGIKHACLNGNTFEMVAGEVKINNTNLEVLI